jgi:pimeloyl-ACP methyl ester carboxylesterase
MTDLILLHGGQHGSWCWEPFTRVLDAQENPFARIIALDMPGCGQKRDRDPTGLSLAQITRELNDDLRSAQVRDAVLVGHSIAGVLLPMMAVEDPALFSQLVYLTTAGPAEGQTIMQMMGASSRGAHPDQVGWPMDPATAAPDAMLQAMFGRDLDQEQLAWLLAEVAQDKTPPATHMEPVSRSGYLELGMKATYIVTLRDDILPPAWQRRFAQRLNCGDRVEIDTPHEPFISHPQLLASTLISTVFS